MKKLFSFLILPLVILFGISVTQNIEVSATEHADVITRMYFTDKNGKELTPPEIDQWEQFRINADFVLHNNLVKAGDTTVVQLPQEITFGNTTAFDITDATGNVVAKAVVDKDTKQVVVTYEKYVETHSNITGSFFFYVRIDHTKVTTKTQVPIDVKVSGKVFHVGEVDFQGIGEPEKSDLNKVGWQNETDPTIGHYAIAINRANKDMTNIKVVDVLTDSNITYLKETFKVYKGTWVWRNGDWALDSEQQITDSVVFNFEEGKFSVTLPNLSGSEGIRISYQVKIPYTPSDGEKFKNNVTLTAENNISKSANSTYTFYQGGGKAEGYVYKIQIKKVAEDGTALKGAKFDVIRDRSGLTVAQVETDDNGIAEISDLLQDTYTLKET